jgi:hypothetical protein
MDRCTIEEARGFIGNGLTNLTPQQVARLRTVSDDDVPRLSNSADFFSISETNRRLTLALHREARRTTWLTFGVFVLTAALVVLTVVLVRFTLNQRAPATSQAVPQELRAVPSSGSPGSAAPRSE